MQQIKHFWNYGVILTLLSMTGCYQEAPKQADSNVSSDTSPPQVPSITHPPIAVRVAHPAVIAHPAVEPEPSFDESTCVTVNLSSPQSPSHGVQVQNTKGKMTIKVHDESTCVRLTGTHKGSVTLSASTDQPFGIILDNASILGNQTSGYLKLKTNRKESLDEHAFNLRLKGTNTIRGGFTSNAKHVLRAKSSLNITGTGTLHVSAHYKTAIHVEDTFRLYSGKVYANIDRTEKTIWKTSKSKRPKYEEGFGIQVGNAFEMLGGALVVTAMDSVAHEGAEARGIKVDGEESAYGAGKGYIRIKAGDLFIQSDAKALSAGWDREHDAKTASTEDDPVPDVAISGGRVRISTFAKPRDALRADSHLDPEGIEGKHNVAITGGEIIVKATGTAIHADDTLHIDGGTLVAWSAYRDAMDANASILLSGGTVIALGSNETEAGIAADKSRHITYTGGVVFAMGGYNHVPEAPGSIGSFAQYGTKHHGEPTTFAMPNMPNGIVSVHGANTPKTSAPKNTPGTFKPAVLERHAPLSEFASSTLALTHKGNNSIIASLHVPGNYSGGTNVLILHPEITKNTPYTFYPNADLHATAAAQTFNFGDGIRLILKGQASGSESKEIIGGIATDSENIGAKPWPIHIVAGAMIQVMPLAPASPQKQK